MTHGRRIPDLTFLLRLGLMLAVFALLVIPHPGMSAPPHMAHHTAAGMDSPMGCGHDMTRDALCKMLCSGALKVDDPAPLAQFEAVATVRWTVETGPVWTSQHPDPAQRPPDSAATV
jgi:hypothetical protein